MDGTLELAASYAILQTKNLGLAEVGPDELLLGCLRTLSQFGIVHLGPWVFDLEELGIDWLEHRDKLSSKVIYSHAVTGLLDRAALIARADGISSFQVGHLLVAFATEDAGLMGELKRIHGITSATWRAAIAQLGSLTAKQPTLTESVTLPVLQRDYLTPEEAAETLGLHVQTLRGYVRSGKMPAFRLAGQRAIRIRRIDLESILEPLPSINLP